MAKGQHYSKHQQKIIHRYYEHQDTILLTRLSEIVSDLYLCEDPKKAAKLWERAAQALAKTDANPAQRDKVLKDRNVQALAALVNDLSGAG